MKSPMLLNAGSLFALTLISSAIPLFGLPQVASAQSDIVQGVEDLYNSATESTQTRYKREQAEQDAIRRQQDDARWREEAEQRDRENNQRNSREPNPPLNVFPPKALRPRSAPTNDLKVEVFVASACPECEQLETFLKQSGVSYVRYNLEQDHAAEQDYLSNIGRGVVPVTRIGTTIIRGYEADKIRAAISQAKGGFAGHDDSWNANNAGRLNTSPEPQLPPARDNGRFIPYEADGSPHRDSFDAGQPMGAVVPTQPEDPHY